MSDQRTEISFEVTAAEAAVLDAYCVAYAIKRTVVMRQLLKEWSEEQHRIATLILRVAGSKPDSSGVGRE